jgi:hypothetical protein
VLILLTRRADAAEEESLSPEWNEICEFTLFAVVLLSLAVSQLDALVRNQRHIRKMVQGTYKVCCKVFTYLLSDGNPSVFPFRIMCSAKKTCVDEVLKVLTVLHHCYLPCASTSCRSS